MRRLLGLFVSLGVAMVFLTTALAFSHAQQPVGGGTTTVTKTVQVAPAEKTAEVVKKEAVKADSTKRPAIKFKVFDETDKKKAVVKREAMQKAAARMQAIQILGMAQPAVVPGEPNAQLLQQYRPMLWAEYHLARSVCNLSPEQRKAIARDAEHALQEAIAKSGMNAHGGRVIMRGANGILAVSQRQEPEETIREGLMKAVKDHLKPEQAAKYQEELDKRAAHRKRITVDNITAKIDESLFLTTEQRDKLRELLAANWQESWCPSPESLLMNAQMLPQIPDQFIVPVLNETQRSIWRGLNKFHGANFRAFGFMVNNMMGGDSPEDDTLKEAREAETKAREEKRTKKEEAAKKEVEVKKVERVKEK